MLGWLTTCWGVLVVVVDAPTGAGTTVVGAAGAVVVVVSGTVVGETGFVLTVGLAVVVVEVVDVVEVVEGCRATVVVVRRRTGDR